MDLDQREIYSISQLNREVKQLLQQNFPLLWIEGEISNLARPASGHIYFSLKDANAQVRCAMFRNANRSLPFQPEDGMHVLVRARVGVYEPRGEYQLTIEHMEEAGIGVLQRKYEELKTKLKQEGLFDASEKKPLPPFPKQISVVTSPSGAAIRDILSVLQRRYPLAEVCIYAVPVQGEGSATQITRAIQAIEQRNTSDVIILARGGGSIEDLWSFNDETLARTLHTAKIPIVSGVGHEIDFTIADFVADVRAATPSAAAELVVPHQDELITNFNQLKASLLYYIEDYVSTIYQSLDWLNQQLAFFHPKQTIERNKQLVNELFRRIVSASKINMAEAHKQFNNLQHRFENHSPQYRVQQAKLVLASLEKSIQQHGTAKLEQSKQQLNSLARTLDAISPLATLDRGYAIVTQDKNGRILLDPANAQHEEEISIQLAKGRLSAKVEK